MSDALLNLPFPLQGIDQNRAFGRQRPGTTAVALNVRAVDHTTGRARGASRPGLFRFVTDDVPAGEELIQHLNTIVVGDPDALTGAPDFPPPDTIEDPSDPGPSEWWGHGPVNEDDPTITGLTEHSRNPGGPGSSRKVLPRKVRNGGNARQPNKNSKRTKRPDTLDLAVLDLTPRFKFIGYAEYSYSYNLGSTQNTSATFTGVTCWPYRPAVGIQPTMSPSALETLQAEKNAYFARIAYQNVSGISLVREWWASQDPVTGYALPTGSVCNCADVHQYGGYDGPAGNSVECPEGL